MPTVLSWLPAQTNIQVIVSFGEFCNNLGQAQYVMILCFSSQIPASPPPFAPPGQESQGPEKEVGGNYFFQTRVQSMEKQ